MDIEQLSNAWYASIYDQEETGTEDVALILELIGPQAQKVLEICCGTGRILVPLAKAGHDATGLDFDAAMMARIPEKSDGLDKLRYVQADALAADWGNDFDVVVIAGNALMNIVTSGDYEAAQRQFIEKARAALKTGGHLLLDFNLFENPAEIFGLPETQERAIFEGTDERGIYGKFSLCAGEQYDPQSQMVTGKRRLDLILPSGQKFSKESQSVKRIPTLADVSGWLVENHFETEQIYGAYDKSPISAQTNRAIIYAKKTE